MSCYRHLVAVAFALALVTPVFAWQDDAPEPTLVVGSVAPDINIEHWLSFGADGRFSKVNKFEPGKVYIVEFWATWCPPCVASMPHLSKLQDKYADKGVQVISTSDEPLERVQAFLEKEVRGDPSKTYAQLTKNYCLATDPDGSTHASYTEVSGLPGIPAAFLIGKTGKVEWMGHPLEIDEPLELVVTDKFDALAYQKVQAERKKRQEEIGTAVGDIMQQVQSGRADQGLAKLDDLISTASEDEQVSLKLLKVELLVALEKPAVAVSQIDRLLENAAFKGSDKAQQRTELKMMKFQIMSASGLPGIEKLFFEVAESAKDPELQNVVAWSVVQMHLDGTIVNPQMVTKARALADSAVAAMPVADVLETQAHLVFMQGDADQAIAIQTQAIAKAKDPRLKARLTAFLEEWQSENAPRVLETESGEALQAPPG